MYQITHMNILMILLILYVCIIIIFMSVSCFQCMHKRDAFEKQKLTRY